MAIIRKPAITILYNNIDITSDLSTFLISFKYHDKLSGDSPSIDLRLDDSEQLFQNEWFPESTARLSFTLGYVEESQVLELDNFEIDKPRFDFSLRGDTITIGAQQTPFSKSLREERSQEYENQSLKEIIETIAKRQNLTIKGTVPDITFERLTQNEESDLQFLTRIAQDYGHLFKVEGENLIIYTWDEINEQPTSFTLDRSTKATITAEKKLDGIYKEAHLVYEQTDDEEVIEAIVSAKRSNNSDDVLTVNLRSESIAQGEAIAQEKLRQANANEFTCTISCEGEPRYIAGINFTLEGYGKFDGKWQIQEAEHNFTNRSGWTTRLQCQKLD